MSRVLPYVLRNPRLEAAFANVTMKTTDKTHGWHHSAECLCSPWNHDRLWVALEDLNSYMSEQVFSWSRSSTGTFDSMRPAHQRFYTFYCAKRHNVQVIAGGIEDLNAHSAFSIMVNTQRPYTYNE